MHGKGNDPEKSSKCEKKKPSSVEISHEQQRESRRGSKSADVPEPVFRRDSLTLRVSIRVSPKLGTRRAISIGGAEVWAYMRAIAIAALQNFPKLQRGIPASVKSVCGTTT